MADIERKANIVTKNAYTMVPMHKLTAHKLIQDEIKQFRDLTELPEEILTSRFVFVLELIDGSNNVIAVQQNANQPLVEEYKEYKIKTIKIRYLLLFDASSKEHQKQGSKLILEL